MHAFQWRVLSVYVLLTIPRALRVIECVETGKVTMITRRRKLRPRMIPVNTEAIRQAAESERNTVCVISRYMFCEMDECFWGGTLLWSGRMSMHLFWIHSKGQDHREPHLSHPHKQSKIVQEVIVIHKGSGHYFKVLQKIEMMTIQKWCQSPSIWTHSKTPWPPARTLIFCVDI